MFRPLKLVSVGKPPSKGLLLYAIKRGVLCKFIGAIAGLYNNCFEYCLVNFEELLVYYAEFPFLMDLI